MPELFPRSVAYDSTWVRENRMGPNVLWLAESLASQMTLTSGSRLLDLGCGMALSSVFFAQEFGAEVWATDLWIKPTENWERIKTAGLTGRVHPIYAEAHALPYANGFFDVITSLDAYHYFGTDDLYLKQVLRFLRPGGEIGIICPGFRREVRSGDGPDYLEELYRDDWHTFHSPEWWRNHWEKTGLVEVTCADEPPEAAAIWAEFVEHTSDAERTAIEADADRLLTFARIIARKR